LWLNFVIYRQESDSSLRAELEELGFSLRALAVSTGDLSLLLKASTVGIAAGQRQEETYAVRNLLAANKSLSRLLTTVGITAIANAALGVQSAALDATYFDKNAKTNWKVPAHQDLVIPATAVPCGSPRIERYGTTYTEPPTEFLRQLVALRIHFDDCPVDNGALSVVPCSHREKLGDARILSMPPSAFVACAARAGDILLMKPMLVHRSSPAVQPHHRRVLHVVYGPIQ
jgi:hypothetical protein